MASANAFLKSQISEEKGQVAEPDVRIGGAVQDLKQQPSVHRYSSSSGELPGLAARDSPCEAGLLSLIGPGWDARARGPVDGSCEVYQLSTVQLQSNSLDGIAGGVRLRWIVFYH